MAGERYRFVAEPKKGGVDIAGCWGGPACSVDVAGDSGNGDWALAPV